MRFALILPGLVLGLAGCDAALGMDAPSLSPCASGCVDATSTGDDASTASADATPDGAGPADVTSDTRSLVDATGGKDATASMDASDAAPPPEAGSVDAPIDVVIDQGPIVGLRCGGGSFGATGCHGGTPECCQTGSGGGTVFSCVANEAACTGYPIACADYNDCSGTDVCCHFGSHQVCTTQSGCPNTELVCSTSLTDSCPSGWVCDVPWFDGGTQSPYLGCMP